MSATRENAQLLEGRVTFYFSGWDEDPRETAEILEIRVWFSKLTGEFPYWLHFLEKQGDSILHAMRLLCTGHYENFLVTNDINTAKINTSDLFVDDVQRFNAMILST